MGINGQVATMKCLLMAGIKGLKLNTTLSSVDNVEQTRSYQNLDTNKKAPTLTHGDFSVSGVRAILTYLDIRGSGMSLTPKKARTLGEQNYWIDVCDQTLAPAVESYIKGEATAEDEACIDKVLASLDRALSANNYIVGQVSFAEPHIAAYAALLNCCGFSMSIYPNIANWFVRLEKSMPERIKADFAAMGDKSKSQVA